MMRYVGVVGLISKYVYGEARNAVFRTVRVAEALSYVFEHAVENNPDSILAKLDEFSTTQQMLINVGKEKGRIMDKIIQDSNPKVVLELGAYVGYSAVRIARLLPEGGKLISIEKNPLNAAIATKVCEYAGLQSKVKIIVGSAADVIPLLRTKYGVDKLDFAFIDHWKDRYLPDIKLIEENNLLKKGSIVVADNVLIPGAPAYLEYIRNNPNYETKLCQTSVENMNGWEDGLEVSTYVQD